MSAKSGSSDDPAGSDKDKGEFVGVVRYSSSALRAIPNKLLEVPLTQQQKQLENSQEESKDNLQDDLVMPIPQDVVSLQNAKPSPLLDEISQGVVSLRDQIRTNERNLVEALEFLETLTHTSHMMRNLMMDLLDLA